MKSSIIDTPRIHTQEDLFGIKKYQEALVKYIELAETPITIALQGEWGSGKTSLMNLLRWDLCDKEGSSYYPIWINTWQYSLMRTPMQAILGILEGIVNQIGELHPSEKQWEERKKKIGVLFKKMACIGTKVAANYIGINEGAVDDLINGEGNQHSDSEIVQFKIEIKELINSALEQDPEKKGFTFYIDDLDRIDPPVAVQILELLKNIFDLNKCIFILAIDYDVVIKGLKPKFGELTEKNEREFRSFFDKIIQLPFSMPVQSYNIDTFLIAALSKIEFFTKEELTDNELTENISEIARLSVGTNPRSLKRLTNTLSLISIINGMDSDTQNDKHTKTINFGLVCIQIAYPYVYDQLIEEPDFKAWNEAVASRLKLKVLTEEEKTRLDSTEEFDEEWEKITFRMCQESSYLSNRAFQISGLLNCLATVINNDDDLGNIIESTIKMSAVTNIKAFDAAPKTREKVGRGYWEKKGLSKHLDIIEKIAKTLPFIQDNSYEINYSATRYIGFINKETGKTSNFFTFVPKGKFILLEIPRIPEDKKFEESMNKMGILKDLRFVPGRDPAYNCKFYLEDEITEDFIKAINIFIAKGKEVHSC